MKLYYVFILTCFLFSALKAQEITIKGTVFENDSINTIPFAYVVNKNTRLGVTSNEDGKYSIKAKHTDTLIVSYLGKLPVKINLNNFKSVNGIINKDVYLHNKPHQLKEVTIRSIEFSKEQRKQYERYIYKPKETDPVHHPISFIYDRFSKDAQSREKLRQFYEQDLIEEAARNRLTNVLIVRLTGNPSMNFDKLQSICHLSNSYIATALEYDLYLQVRKCYKSYLLNRE